MRLVSTLPAATRARRAVVVAGVAGVVVVVGGWTAVAAPRRGLLLVFLGLVVIHAAIRRRQDLLLLAALPGWRVAQVAEPSPVLRHHGSVDGIDELRRMAGHEVGVVATDHGWRVLGAADVADAVLAHADGRFSGDWDRYLHEVPLLDADVPVARLRRLPDGGEHWLVRDGVRPPRVVTAGSIYHAVRNRTAPARSRSRPVVERAGRSGRSDVELRA